MNVRFTPKAVIHTGQANVRFAPKADIQDKAPFMHHEKALVRPLAIGRSQAAGLRLIPSHQS